MLINCLFLIFLLSVTKSTKNSKSYGFFPPRKKKKIAFKFVWEIKNEDKNDLVNRKNPLDFILNFQGEVNTEHLKVFQDTLLHETGNFFLP